MVSKFDDPGTPRAVWDGVVGGIELAEEPRSVVAGVTRAGIACYARDGRVRPHVSVENRKSTEARLYDK